MNHGAIIEAAARAVRQASGRELNELDSLRLATAALDAVAPLIRAAALEEAAQVAEDYDGEFEEIHMAQGDIAAAIRALAQAESSAA